VHRAKLKVKHDQGLAFDTNQLADKVLNFLQRIRGLNSLSPEELDVLLYDRRFELLGTLNSSEASAADTEDRLPKYTDIPNQHELHEALLGGIIPSGYQSVAHVLYPESVPWPIRKEQGAAKATPEEEESEEVPASELAQPASVVPAIPSSASPTRSIPKSAVVSPTKAKPDGQRHSVHSSIESGDIAASPDGLFAILEDNGSKQDLSGNSGHLRDHPHWQGTPRSHTDKERLRQVTLCGQKVSTSVRGKPVLEQSDDVIALYMKAANDERYNAAHEERVRLEKAVKLEQYQEKKLVERIKALEMMRTAEIEHQSDIRKREARRLARKEELTKNLQESWVVRLEKEKEQENIAKQQEKEKAEAEKRLKRHNEKQKDVIRDWWRNKDKHDDAKAEQERLVKQKEKEEQENTARLKKTFKQVVAEQKVQRLLESIEQRPPVPPPLFNVSRAHDLPRPLIELSDAGSDKGSSSARGRPLSWTKQAKAVADSYGLSAREHRAVEDRMNRAIHGAGRLADYDSS
jgi:hypothetical protein